MALLFAMAAAVAPRPATGAAIEITSAKFGNLLYVTDPKTFDVAVYSGFATVSGVLVTEVQDPYGAVVLHDQFPVSITWSSVHRQLTIPSTVQGRFAVTAKLYDQTLTEPPLASADSAVGVVPPPTSPDLDDRSAVGYTVMPAESGVFNETPNADAIAKEMQDLGVKWVRYGFHWSTDARTTRPNTADPAWLDTSSYGVWVDAFRSHGINVLGALVGSARWASSHPDDEREITYPDPSTVWGPYWAASTPNPSDWELFVRTMQERFAGRINDWEIWDEPDSFLFYEPAQLFTPAAVGQLFGNLVSLTATTLKTVNPSARVVVNFASTGSNAFENAFVPLGGPSLDAFGYHYGGPATVNHAKILLLNAHIPPKPFWNTEAAGGTHDLLPAWIRQRAAGATRLFPFIWAYFQDGDLPFGTYPLGPFYTPDALAIAVRTLSDQVGRADFVRTFAVKTDGTVNGYVFDDAGRTVIAVVREDPAVDVWAPTNPARQLVVSVPAGTTTVTATDAMGNAATLVPLAGQVRVPLDGNPVYLEGIDVHLARPLDFVAYTTTACGNGNLDPGEECDDGNTIDGDVCSNACMYACPPTPRTDCAGPSVASVLLRTHTLKPAASKLVFKWSGNTGGLLNLGNPWATTSYAFCLYEQPPSGAARAITLVAPAGGTCGTKPCWTGKVPVFFTYVDTARTVRGLKKLRVKTSASGVGSISLMAGGSALPLPTLPLGTPVVAQMEVIGGTCWDAVFDTAILRNDANGFSAQIKAP